MSKIGIDLARCKDETVEALQNCRFVGVADLSPGQSAKRRACFGWLVVWVGVYKGSRISFLCNVIMGTRWFNDISLACFPTVFPSSFIPTIRETHHDCDNRRVMFHDPGNSATGKVITLASASPNSPP